jgi:hypothetical protein
MRLWETFDLASLLVGLLLGAVGAFLLRLHALKRLSLDIRRIGITLGVEGFEEPVPETGGLRVGNISGSTVGDMAGGDIDKSRHEIDRSNRLSNVLQAIAQDRGVMIVRYESFDVRTSDPTFRDSFKAKEEHADWADRDRIWLEHCFDHPDIRQQVDTKVGGLQKDGWRVRMVDFDGLTEGIHIRLELQKPYAEFRP